MRFGNAWGSERIDESRREERRASARDRLNFDEWNDLLSPIHGASSRRDPAEPSPRLSRTITETRRSVRSHVSF